MISPEDVSGVRVDAEWISAHIGDPAVRLVEVDVSPAAYQEGHIPGAVLWDAYGDLRDQSYKPVSRGQLERLMSRSGLTEDATVVLYGYGAHLGFWLMKAYGHQDVRLLAGPRDQWPDSGAAWSTDETEPAETSYPLPPENPELLASRQAVETAIDDSGTVLLDVRSELEYSGERFWPSGASEDVGRAGHLPGAVSIPIDLLRNEPGALKGAGELRRAFEERGVTKDRAVIVYCTIGNRASQAWFALSQVLGYPRASVYYGSWVEWGKESDTPVEPSATS